MRGAGLGIGGCLLLVVILIAVNLTLGSMAAHYVIQVWSGKDIAWGWSALIGLFGGELTIPAAIITWLLVQAGVK